MSLHTLRKVATKTFSAGLAATAAVAMTGVVAAAERADEVRPEVEAPADEAGEGLQIAEDAKNRSDLEGDVDEDGVSAEGLPEDLPDNAVADEVLEVIRNWDGDRGREFGEAVSQAAQANRNGEGAPEDAGSQADDVRQDGNAPDDVRQDSEHRPADD